ncbi:MAG: chloride channel protein [Flavobacteriaceae bacterium]|nr:chloride channel protein [Flavobacteriaceae bacterium]
MTPLIIASVTAVLTSYFFFGDDVLFHFQLIDRFEFQDVFFLFLLGLTTALVSVHFSKVYHYVAQAFKN